MTLDDWIEMFYWYSQSAFVFVSRRQSAFPVLVVLDGQKLHFVVICMLPMHSNGFASTLLLVWFCFELLHTFLYIHISLSLSAFCFQGERICFTRWHLCTPYPGSKYLLLLTTDVPNGHSLNDHIRTKCIMKHHEGACICLLWRLHHQKQYEYIYFN